MPKTYHLVLSSVIVPDAFYLFISKLKQKKLIINKTMLYDSSSAPLIRCSFFSVLNVKDSIVWISQKKEEEEERNK